MSDNPARRTEHTLLATDDAMVWAEEFVRIFSGQVISDENEAVNVGSMVAWFANAMQTAVNLYERRKLHEKGELTETETFLKNWDEEHPEDSEEDLEEAVTLEEQFLEGFKEGRTPEV